MYIHICTYTFTCVRMYMSMYTFVCIYIFVGVYVHTHTYISVYIHTYEYICERVCAYVYMCVYIYIYMLCICAGYELKTPSVQLDPSTFFVEFTAERQPKLHKSGSSSIVMYINVIYTHTHTTNIFMRSSCTTHVAPFPRDHPNTHFNKTGNERLP
jgi:hypothetical protein